MLGVGPDARFMKGVTAGELMNGESAEGDEADGAGVRG